MSIGFINFFLLSHRVYDIYLFTYVCIGCILTENTAFYGYLRTREEVRKWYQQKGVMLSGS